MLHIVNLIDNTSEKSRHMKTPSHIAIGWCCARVLRLPPRDARILIAGAVLPDLPVVVGWSLIAGYTSIANGGPDPGIIRETMDRLYFSDSILACLHNLFHAPLSLLLLICGAWVFLAGYPNVRRLVVLLIAGAASHSLLDILTHVNDGPLLFWPLERTIRITGPVSHWNPAYGGAWFTALETLGSVAFCAYWGFRRFVCGGFGGESRPVVSKPTL